MYEEKQKMQAEIRKLKDELQEALTNNADLEEKLSMVKDAVKSIGQLKEQLSKKEDIVQRLKSEVANLQNNLYTADSTTQSVRTELA